ncbi:hypothetical protein SDC9_04169 [bioreactor metagenome]|uniref:Uncharacterized protein n=1 Tax=bioreactor metagenome TaxID=1076179 RepID=A0A644SVH9_9ZZZZ|nr:hypothetical protein [Negativicutes bacterium]
MSNQEKTINVTPTGDILVIREGVAPDVFQYNGFKYTADSTPALISLVQSKSVKEHCVIAYTENGFQAILNDQVFDRKQDRITYGFKKSQQYKEWQQILESGFVFNQKQFIDFLRRREPDEIIHVESLIAAIQNFKYVTNVSGDFTFDDRNNYTFAFKVGDAEGTVRLPQFIYADIEIYNESDFVQKMELELEVQKPKSEGERLLFALTCPKLPRYQKEAVKYEIDKVKTELDGYLIVAGSI